MVDDAVARIRRAREAGERALTEPEGKRVLAAFGVRVPRSTVVTNPADVASAVRWLAAPLVVKIVSPDILHKSDAGGVALGVQDVDGVQRAIEVMVGRANARGARVDGFVVEEMQRPGVELAIGATRDPQFGPMLMVGLGGIFVEILRDVAFRLCPITERDARAMLRELRGAGLLDGVRGSPRVDREAVVELLVRIGGPEGLVMQLADDIAELDINPLIGSGSDIDGTRYVCSPPMPSASRLLARIVSVGH
jgi:hypothetical protein